MQDRRRDITIAAAGVLFFGVAIAFGVHVLLGGTYETRTVLAMSLRSLVWAIVVGIVIYKPAARPWSDAA